MLFSYKGKSEIWKIMKNRRFLLNNLRHIQVSFLFREMQNSKEVQYFLLH